MSRFLPYFPEQPCLLPPDVRDVLGSDHLCFFVHEVVERWDLAAFVDAYAEEGGGLYPPALMLKVWLYAYALGVTSSRKLEQRIREDLAFRFLAGGAQPDFWALNAFRQRHKRGINDVFVQVLELVRELGMARLGTVAVDSTRIKASASPDRIVREQRPQRVRDRRKIRQWQQALTSDDPNPGAVTVPADSLPAQLPPLRKLVKRSRTDPEARFLRERGGRFVLGYTGEIAVSEDHFIVAARVTQNAHDAQALTPLVEEVERGCRARPQRILADSGFFSNDAVLALEQKQIEVYIPDPQMAAEINRGGVAHEDPRHGPTLRRMRRRLRTKTGRQHYDRRKAIIEPVFGVLKEQRDLPASAFGAFLTSRWSSRSERWRTTSPAGSYGDSPTLGRNASLNPSHGT